MGTVRVNIEVAWEFRNFMKTLLIILLIIFLNSILFAQTNQQPSSKPAEKELSVEQRQIVNLTLATFLNAEFGFFGVDV